jgi:hypothetical protein
MAEFTCVDDRGRLWEIKNLLTPEEFQDLISLDWQNLPWVRGPGQKDWLRRSIDWAHSDVKRVSGYINNKLVEINQGLGVNFTHISGHFWLDEPGFKVDMHTDGELPYVMQMYWIMPGDEYGTGFYRYKDSKDLLYQFKSIPNTGYIMMNQPDRDGSQPLSWHGMFYPVPEGTIRLSSYWYFA